MVRREPLGRKERERRLLEQFAPWCREFPEGEIEESETPDFVVVSPAGRRVGIELTEVLRQGEAGEDRGKGSPHRRYENLIDQFVRNAEDRYYESYSLPVYAHFTWPPFGSAEQSLTTGLAKELSPVAARLAEECLRGSVLSSVTLSGTEPRLSGTPLDGVLDSMSVRKSGYVDSSGRGSPWGSTKSSRRAVASIEDLAAAITAKDSRAGACRKKCDEAWLLLVLASPLASFDSVEEPVLTHWFSSSFDRVALLCLGSNSNHRALTLYRGEGY